MAVTEVLMGRAVMRAAITDEVSAVTRKAIDLSVGAWALVINPLHYDSWF